MYDRYRALGRACTSGRIPFRSCIGCNSTGNTVYHEVTQIHDPAATLTLMVCGAGERGAWGYLDVACGTRIPVEPDPLFAARFQALNPHLRRCVPARRPRRRRQLDVRVERRASHP